MATEQVALIPVVYIREIAAPPVDYRYMLMAYWPAGCGRWKVFPERYGHPDAESLKHEIVIRRNTGWTHLRILELPE